MMDIHGIAKIWPEMTPEEWGEFVVDVGANGLLQPIVTWRDAIVDGKHRQRACDETGVEPRYDALDASWDEPMVVMHCASLHRRRNLDVSQRAAVALLVHDVLAPAARIGRPPKLAPRGATSGKTAQAAAKVTGSSARSIERAQRVREASPEAFAQVKAGTLPLKVAERVAKAAPEDRAAVLSQLTTSTRTEAEGDSWGTPPEWIALARTVMGGIDTDPASNDHAQITVQAAQYFTAQDDGLAQEWRGRVWMNPPYSQPLVGRFADHLLAEIDAGRVTQACVLVNNTTDTQVGQKMLSQCAAALFPEGRVSFIVPGTSTALQGSRQGQMLLYFGPNIKRFVSACAGLGWVGVSP